MQTLTEATSFVQDLKLGHYVKVPPRATFVGASSFCRFRFVFVGTLTLRICSAISSHHPCSILASRGKDVDVPQRPGYLYR